MEKTDVCWDDVFGLSEAKCQLKQAAILPQTQPQLFKGKQLLL